jgi:(hydroxyamino)benzene mutase
MDSIQKYVFVAGLLLFLVGLLNGLIIPKTKAPRLSLSAHLTAVQSGTFLIAIACAWPVFAMSHMMSLLAAGALSGSLITLWFAFFLAGILGAGHGLTIAGEGIETGAFQQRIVSIFLGIGVLGTLGTCLYLSWLAVIGVLY